MAHPVEQLAEGRVTLLCGDCLALLPTLDANSVDAVVTDPPYGLEFMGKEWDKFADMPRKINGTGGREAPFAHHAVKLDGSRGKNFQAFSEEWAREVYRVIRPGGHLLSFGGTRTYHRMACAIEDAGFEIRDQIEFDHSMEMEYTAFEGSLSDEQRRQFGKLFRESGPGRLAYRFGSGFPKSSNVSRAISERCMCGMRDRASIQTAVASRPILQQKVCGEGQASAPNATDLRDLPSSLDATNALSGCEGQDLFAGMQRKGNLIQEQGQDQSSPDSMRLLREACIQGPDESETECRGILQPILQSEGSIRPSVDAAFAQGTCSVDGIESRELPPENEWSAQSRMEGWIDLPETPRQLREREVCSLPAGFDFDGAEGWVHNGAPASDGQVDRSSATPSGMRSPQGPPTIEQRSNQSGIMAVQPQPQKRGAWDCCGRCGKPIIPEGLGTALKPACEPIVLARKPLSEPTIAANVLKWGTGALNIGGCRVGTEGVNDPNWRRAGRIDTGGVGCDRMSLARQFREMPESLNEKGRWPANVIHDGSDEVVGAFPETGLSTGGRCGDNNVFGTLKGETRGFTAGDPGYGDSGSAARFFYTAKADHDDRLGSKHPTVKPLDLMQYLCRLVCPPDGTVLDPFAGTGTTGEACLREGFKAILIERELDYCQDIRRRMELALAGRGERNRRSIDAAGKRQGVADLPLFR